MTVNLLLISERSERLLGFPLKKLLFFSSFQARQIMSDKETPGFTEQDAVMLFGIAHHFQAETGDRAYSDRIADLATRVKAAAHAQLAIPTPPPPSETVHICGGCGFISDTTDKHDCPEPYKAFLAATMAKRAEEMGITLEELEAKAKAWIAPPSETKLSEAIEKLIRLTRNQMYVDKDYGRTPDGQETQALILRNIARSSLESIYREQMTELVELRDIKAFAAHKLQQYLEELSALRSLQLTPEEAGHVLATLGSQYGEDCRPGLFGKLRAIVEATNGR